MEQHGVETKSLTMLHDLQRGYHAVAESAIKALQNYANDGGMFINSLTQVDKEVVTVPFEAIFSAVSAPSAANLLEDIPSVLDNASKHIEHSQVWFVSIHHTVSGLQP